jgi:hypothetical protein
MLRRAKASPDYTNYLTFLVSATQQPSSINLPRDSYDLARSAAAIALKNSVKSSYKTLSDGSKLYIRSSILQGLQDPSIQIRSYAGNVITEVVQQGGILSWPDLLLNLFTMVENADGKFARTTQEGAMSALVKICEDNREALDREYEGQHPLSFLFPKLLRNTASPHAKIRADCLACINVFLPDQTAVVMSNLDALLKQLFSLAPDTSDEVRKQVCRSLLHIAEVSPESIVPNLEGIVNYILTQQRNQDNSELALDAAEFWLCVGEDDRIVPHLRPYLPHIIPVLLESLVYSESEILMLEDDFDKADVEDRAQDIKPIFAQAKESRALAASKGSDAAKRDDMSEGEISDDDVGSPEDEWTLRKCSAGSLDALASHFHEPVFEVTLPYLKENLTHKEWPYREAAVLALGAIADGCMDAVLPHLPDLTTYLLSLLQDSEPVVRSITCWTLGRYSAWAANLDEPGQQQYFVPIMDGLLQRMLDSSKRVQESATSAFANLEEKAKAGLQPYCAVIIRQFVQCFATFKDRNIVLLYDCVQTLAEHVGEQLKTPELVNLLMPALIGRWNKVSDQSREMFPLLECLSYVATALGGSFEPFAQPIFSRCVTIIHRNLEEAMQASSNPGLEVPEKDFLVTSLDLLSAIVQALDEQRSTELVASSQPSIFQLLAYCMKEENNDVRQSAYALLGDFAVFLFAQLRPWVPSMLDIVIAQLDMTQVQYDGEETNYAVINNACWSAGEIAMRHKGGMAPYVPQLLEKLFVILVNKKVPDNLLENAAIALGRLGYGSAEAVAPHLADLAPLFLDAIARVPWMDEKAHALVGFSRVVARNPRAVTGPLLMQLFVEMAKAPPTFLAGGGDAEADAEVNGLAAFREACVTSEA